MDNSYIIVVVGIAAQEGHEQCVVALLEHGADPNHSDACGRNALRVAAKSGHRGVVRLIEEYNIRSHKSAHTSSSANSITSGSTAETKPSCAVLYPGTSDWADQQRRSMVSLGNHSSNSKSSSNLTGSSHSSRHGDRQRENVQNTQVASAIINYKITYVFVCSHCRLRNSYSNVLVVVKHGL